MKKNEIDTSMEGLKKIGIEVNDSQYLDLVILNAEVKTGMYDDIPVYPMIMILKILNAI